MFFFLVVAALVTSLSACGSIKADYIYSSNVSASSLEAATEPILKINPDPVTLKIYLFGSENAHYRNVEPIVAEFEKQTKNTLNTSLKITWTPPADYKDKLPLWIASGEEMDLVFDAPWRYLNKFTKDEIYMDLGKYFNNNQYPGLMRAFSPEYLKNNQFFGKTFAIPITNTFMDMEGVYYRKDLLEKYGMKPIASYDDLYAFLEKVAANEDPKKIIPFAGYGKWGFWWLFQDPSRRQLDGKVYSFNPGISASYINVQLSEDGNSVAGVAAYGDVDANYKAFDGKYGKQYVMDNYNSCKKFSRFISLDVLVNDAQSGKHYGATYGTVGGYVNKAAQEAKDIPGAKLAFWPIFKDNENMTPGTRATDFKAWNFLCIPTTSEKSDRTMQFID